MNKEKIQKVLQKHIKLAHDSGEYWTVGEDDASIELFELFEEQTKHLIEQLDYADKLLEKSFLGKSREYVQGLESKVEQLTEQLAESDNYIKECLNNDNAIIKHLENRIAEKEKEIEKLKRRIIALEKQMAENM